MEISMHAHFLEIALQLAQSWEGRCAPNPSVGAVLVKEGRVIASGFHRGAGNPHAEIEALNSVGEEAEGATLYVSLEPCCHFGRTPPCTKSIIERKIVAVYYAHEDPNPKMQGKGAAQLKAVGISCEQIKHLPTELFYIPYDHWTKTRLPWVTAKLALTWDGCIAGLDGVPVTLTGKAAHAWTHKQRARSDAILTTFRTVQRDNPRFSVRLQGCEEQKRPVYVMDPHLEFSEDLQLMDTAAPLTLFHNESVSLARVEALAGRGVRCVALPPDQEGHLLWADIVKVLGSEGRHRVWIEAGGKTVRALLSEQVAHEVYFLLAPQFLGKSAYAAFSDPFSLTDQGYSIAWEGSLGVDGLLKMTRMG
jgi:diaminohydroxyphosphoribosylaminopyrimidine deaminase/5-amino-6-(5-phosphoribosylamino)uracil reductase